MLVSDEERKSQQVPEGGGATTDESHVDGMSHIISVQVTVPYIEIWDIGNNVFLNSRFYIQCNLSTLALV